MLTCSLEISTDVDNLYKIFLSEKLSSPRANCTIKKGKTLIFEIIAKDSVSMKAFTNSILNMIQTYEKTVILTK
jgi:tRNA threonylcarbamoyladenosine modification (KEOPS) complex  Pcc1 subunit